MQNPFIGTPEEPFHLSAGVVLVDKSGHILTHRFDLSKPELQITRFITGLTVEIPYFYALMTETPENGETLLDSAKRGLMEEFGAEGELVHYLGTSIGYFSRHESTVKIEKTTVFFLYGLTHLDETRRASNAIESMSDLLFFKPEELIAIFEAQNTALHRSDFDYAEIVRRAQNFL